MVTIKGKNYVRIGDKLAEVDRLNGNGKPVLKTRMEETKRPDGRVDCVVHVECLQIADKVNR